ncbi:MAG: TIGR00282 family metallophosphoesterase [Treponema sp.]|jgi:metallophosphoesterase (TIGR00282 family)|nr:TIGR00282 family metallophosphoesterase [Treponema sp.]
MNIKRVIMLGDVVGESGLAALEKQLPRMITEYEADFVTVNGENAAEGFGISESTLSRMLAAGADVVTSGNHVWEKREFWPVLHNEKRVLRPANYPAGAEGRGWITIEKNNVSYLVINLQGRKLMTPIDCPFRTFDAIFNADAAPGDARSDAQTATVILVDFHAETTHEKEALAFYLDGRAAVIAGTHTHVQTADNRILPKGSAYITDLGMTGVTDSIIGMDAGICVQRAKRHVPYHMECAQGTASAQGIIVEINVETGKAMKIERINR